VVGSGERQLVTNMSNYAWVMEPDGVGSLKLKLTKNNVSGKQVGKILISVHNQNYDF